MSHQTLDSNVTPEGSPAEQSASRQGPPARRRRRAAEHKPKATQTAQAAQHTDQAEPAAATAAAAAPAPAAIVPPAPAAETPAPAQHDAGADETEEPRPAGRGTRSRRRGGSRKVEVKLVKPAGTTEPALESDTTTHPAGTASDVHAAPAGQSAEAQRAGATEETAGAVGAAAQVRVVPVVTEHAAAPAEREATAVPVAEAPTAPAEPAPRKYRFDRRTSAAAAAEPTVRPERLAIASSAQPVSLTEAARPAPATPLASAETVAPTVEAALEETGPSAGPAAFESPTPKQARESGAVDDILAALGLRDVTPRQGAPAPHTVEPTQAEEEAESAEAEEGVEAEQEAQGAGETEGQGPSRRRRRRRRSNGPHAKGGTEEEAEETPLTPFWPEPSLGGAEARASEYAAEEMPYGASAIEPATRNGYDAYTRSIYGEEEEQRPYAPQARQTRAERAEPQPWDVSAGTRQVRQPESPFGSPEPSYARGFGPQPRGVAGPLRETPYTRPSRTERGTDTPPMSSNQLASMVTHAIQQQTDRLLSELRHTSNPPSMTVMFPPFPSTERVGVFVDVANLHYSSRSMRVTLDFGRLLDFLRGNRRLVRAHAYAPTDPDPRADQAFLSAVKGLGYRITTKNYKTFASGAKKADMDLDLCMDIVRLVDAGALDTVVLVSGDSDFLPLLEYCSDHGVRVEVAAFEDAAAAILRQSCDLFINLSMVDDIRV